jgi:nucleoside-diphosphate-sugar epimerase
MANPSRTLSVWYAIPTCNVPRATKTLRLWKEQGYKICVLIDGDTDAEDFPDGLCDAIVHARKYRGYYQSAHDMLKAIVAVEGGYPDVMVCGGDDMDPDPKHKAAEIAEQCYEKFPTGLFVMQPVGDDLGGTDQICGSPWFGREWLKRGYQGYGPFCTQYFQFFGDEELKEVASELGVLWQRRDLVQKHHHWLRPDVAKEDYQARNETRYWTKDEATFTRRNQSKPESGGRFPGHQLRLPETSFLGATVTITGAGGFIGGHLATRLIHDGAEVTCIDRVPSPWHTLPVAIDDLRYGSMTGDVHQYWRADYVFHLAAEMGGIGYIENYKGDIVANSSRMDLNVLDWCRNHKAGKLIYSSSACVYPANRQLDAKNATGIKEEEAYPADAEDGYGWQKLYTERLCRHYREDFGLNTAVARFHNIFGPYGTYDGGREKAPAALCRKVAKDTGEGIEVWGNGSQLRSYCYVDDCVEGLLRLALSDHPDPINIGSPEAVSVNKLIDHIEVAADKKVERRYDTSKPKGVNGRNADIALAWELLDWSPRHSLKEGIAKTYPWIRSQVQQ